MLKLNKDNVKLCLTNYRWYIAVLWAIFLIPVWFIPQLIISCIAIFLRWMASHLDDIEDNMSEILELYLTWAVRWFYRSLPTETDDKN